MKIIGLLDKTLREILDEYCILLSLECDYIYGITTHDTIDKIFEKYDLCDEPSISPEPFLDIRVLAELEDETTEAEILTIEKVEQIISNLGLKDNLKEKQ